MVKVAVVGAGVVGLCTAVNVQRRMPQARVTVVADRFGPETTSYGSGGIFRSYWTEDLKAKGADKQTVIGWIRDSWNFYYGLATSDQADESGAFIVTGTVASFRPQVEEFRLMKELCIDFHELSKADMDKLQLGHQYSYGYRMTTVMMQCSFLLDWLLKRFKDAGGRVQNRTVKHLSELSGKFDIVVNCCGLRSGETVGDYSSYPVKGHLVHLHAPWIKDFFITDGPPLMNVFPHRDKVVVGGIKEEGNYDVTPDPEVRRLILSRAEALYPQLKGAKVIGEWCGLRPCRPEVRVEKELMDCGGLRKLSVVHNYGHGGRGVFLGWGCGVQAAKYVQELAKHLSPRL